MIFPKNKNVRATWAPLRLADARHLPCRGGFLERFFASPLGEVAKIDN